jgi:hypothetical protein
VAAVRRFLRPLRRVFAQLWHEVIGSFFALFALLGAVSFWRNWQQGAAAAALWIPLAFFLVMAGFAAASFARARRAAKSETGK